MNIDHQFSQFMVQVPEEESTTLGVDTAATVTLMAGRKSTHQYCLYCTLKGPFLSIDQQYYLTMGS